MLANNLGLEGLRSLAEWSEAAVMATVLLVDAVQFEWAGQGMDRRVFHIADQGADVLRKGKIKSHG